MSLFNIIAVLLTLSALFSYLNHRFFHLPTTVGLMLAALLMSLALLVLAALDIHFEDDARLLLERINFSDTLLHGMLAFLLFAGALHIDLEDLSRHKWIIGILATVGILFSSLLIGFASHWIFALLGMDIPLIYCFLFGALISPTDPIAVLGILKSAGAPRALEIKIAGESLFNDGVAVVLFLALIGLITGGEELTASGLLHLFMQEAVGGLVFGLFLGWLAFQLLKSIDDYPVEIIITLALVTGGYSLAEYLHLSAPIAIVVAGLLVGNHGRTFAMSDKTIEHLDSFWELVDEMLNGVLFVLIGLEVLVLTVNGDVLLAGLLIIPMILLVRMLSVGIPITLFQMRRTFPRGTVPILTWGGLRGGISVALALSLPAGSERETLLAVTYIVVVFSILVQGLTIEGLVRRLSLRE
jgi:monovalent cation:H+ antiporter, CPA1 family